MTTTVKYLNVPSGRMLEDNVSHVIKADLADADAAAGVLSLLNGTGRDLFVHRLILRVTTKSDAACTLDAGIVSTNIVDDTLIDGVDVGTAAIDADNITNKGTNGKAQGKLWSNGEYLTASMKTGAAAGLVGQAVVHCTPV